MDWNDTKEISKYYMKYHNKNILDIGEASDNIRL
jgi:hypothetical protein